MGYFIKVLKYGKSYKIYGFLNILFNVFYAIFSALAFVSFIPICFPLTPIANGGDYVYLRDCF